MWLGGCQGWVGEGAGAVRGGTVCVAGRVCGAVGVCGVFAYDYSLTVMSSYNIPAVE